MSGLPPDFVQELRRSMDGEVRDDLATRLLYSTDASIYQIEPLGVAFPRGLDDLQAAASLAWKRRIPLLARGAGSSLAGQAIGQALILDTSRHLNRILHIDPEQRTATVEPGVILSTLNNELQKHGLVFGPDPASADRATLGGSVANNASGAHSILYGMAADHLLSAEVLLSDGSRAAFEPISLQEAERRGLNGDPQGGLPSIEACLYEATLDIYHNHGDAIRQRWPHVWRRASGYGLNYLLGWSPAAPPQWGGYGELGGLPYPPIQPGTINLAPLLAGSEGTLAIMQRLTLRLVPRLPHTILGVIAFGSIPQACDAVPEMLERRPSAVELVPGDLLQLARSVPAYARQLSFVQGEPAAMLVVEFAGDHPGRLLEQARQLGPQALIAETQSQQNQVWNVRKMGLGILNSRPGDVKAISIIEDLAVPVERLGFFVREMERITASHNTFASYYAHASAGCLHIRPLLSLKDARGVAAMRAIAQEAVELTISLGGAVSGEHGDGLARSEWMERAYGSEIVALFRRLKEAADPHNLLNPGKILDAPPMDTHLRYGPDYRARPWGSALDFSDQAGLAGAIEMCNGAGVCRKSEGVMCPSFQANQEEMHSPRGRANLLRALISGKFPTHELAEESVFAALDLCLACKGCKAECPSAVDVARLKYEFTNQYYKARRRPLRDYLFGYIAELAPLGSPVAPLANAILSSRLAHRAGERFFGLSARRSFPRLAPRRQVRQAARHRPSANPDALLLSDAFSRYFHPETELAALRALQAAGLRVNVIPVLGAGRTLISKGMLKPARKHAVRLLKAIQVLDPHMRLPVLGVEPSEIYTLREEILEFFSGYEGIAALAERAWMVDEFLIRPDDSGVAPIGRLVDGRTPLAKGQVVLLHGHCYQKARPPAADGYPVGMEASAAMLEAAGFVVELVDSGCCGMAGGFGYEAEHYDLSMRVGELKLLPAVRRAAQQVKVAAAGTSCRAQIEDGAQRQARHPLCLLVEAMGVIPPFY